MANTNSAAHVRVIEETPAYWRVVFDYPPFNIVDATIFEALQDLLARMNQSPSVLRVEIERVGVVVREDERLTTQRAHDALF